MKKAAAEAGDESPIVFVLLPKHEADQIKDALASYAAAEDTLRRPTPQTDEGKAAQRAMKTRLRHRRRAARRRSSRRSSRGPGSSRAAAPSSRPSTLRDAVETAANRSLIRLFPKFGAGDNANWGKVVTKAREGAPDALDAVGHHGEPTTNAVCKEVLAAVSAGGTKGADLQKRFAAPPFGWPKDAVNGAILTLLAAGNIRAAQDGKDLAGPKELPPTQIGKVTLYKEDEPPTVGQRLAVRGLLTAAGIAYEAGQEGAQISGAAAAAQGSRRPRRRASPAARAARHRPSRRPAGPRRQPAVPGRRRRPRAPQSATSSSWRAADQQREKREAEWHDLRAPAAPRRGPAGRGCRRAGRRGDPRRPSAPRRP